jgi:hypothetical protein
LASHDDDDLMPALVQSDDESGVIDLTDDDDE